MVVVVLTMTVVDVLAVSVVDLSVVVSYLAIYFGFYIGGYLCGIYLLVYTRGREFIWFCSCQIFGSSIQIFHSGEGRVVMEMEQCDKICNCQLLLRRLASHELLAILQNTSPMSFEYAYFCFCL